MNGVSIIGSDRMKAEFGSRPALHVGRPLENGGILGLLVLDDSRSVTLDTAGQILDSVYDNYYLRNFTQDLADEIAGMIGRYAPRGFHIEVGFDEASNSLVLWIREDGL